jgi:hypothetical protein
MNKLLNKRNLFLSLILVSAICIFNVFTACNVSTANLSDVKVCTSLNSSVCDADASSIPGTAPVIYCSAKLNNAPSGTKVTFTWSHAGSELGKADVETGSGTVSSNMNTNGSLEPGKYSVTVKINSDNAKPVTKEFTIE